MKLNGWQRIGIVLSVLWLVAVLLFAAFEYNTADKYRSLSERQSQVFIYWASPVIVDPFELHLGENLDRFSEREQVEILRKRELVSQGLSLDVFVGWLFGWLFLPILASWVLAYVSIFVFGWVRAGFLRGSKGT